MQFREHTFTFNFKSAYFLSFYQIIYEFFAYILNITTFMFLDTAYFNVSHKSYLAGSYQNVFSFI